MSKALSVHPSAIGIVLGFTSDVLSKIGVCGTLECFINFRISIYTRQWIWRSRNPLNFINPNGVLVLMSMELPLCIAPNDIMEIVCRYLMNDIRPVGLSGQLGYKHSIHNQLECSIRCAFSR